MSDLFDQLSEESRKKLRKTTQPKWTAPMLATLTEKRFSDERWIFERKLDGERCLAFRNGSTTRLLSRNRKNLNDTYPELVDALAGQSRDDFIVDGEIVAFEGSVTSFERLQQRMGIHDADEARRSNVAVYFYIFDLLHVDGHDTTKLPLRDRKALLRQALTFEKRLRFTAHRNTEGEKFYKQACQKRWEGVIAKDAQSAYVHARSSKWLKFKCVNQQEFVIGGYTDPQGERTHFGAIVIGYYDDGDLVCAGKVGTGFDDELLKSLGRKMEARQRESSPFDGGTTPGGAVHWIRPDLVGEVAFTEWTRDGQLRHPRFLGLRRDKNAKDVVRERPS